MKIKIIRIISTVIFTAIMYYLCLPALNLQSIGFYSFLGTIGIFYLCTSILELADVRNVTRNITKVPKNVLIGSVVIFGILSLIVIINFVSSPLFNSKSYSKRINVNETETFTDNVKEVDFKALPLLDKDSSRKLGDRVMGQMPELVSQFIVSDLYTQINYNNNIVRVTPLEYAGLIKYFTNKKEGVKGYISVNSVTGESKLTKLEKGMKYMPSAFFGKDLYRKLRLSYPTLIFDTETFEIDNKGNPYWIIPVIKYTGIGLKKDISHVIILDPITGASEKYKVGEVPTWVDHVYSASLVTQQVNDWGKYQSGFFNAIFGQKGVVQTTEGYNYTVMDDDVYLYTGITSTSSDESNIGFILTNLRTKETNFYASPGAEEYSAMASAEGQVQQMSYVSSFPLLINLNNRPTYLISLKDAAGLVKMYAFVDVEDYQKVVVTDSSLGIETAANNYLNNTNIEQNTDKKINDKIIVASITTANIDGNTYYYITSDSNDKFRASIKIASNILPFIKKGDELNIVYSIKKEVTEIIEINKEIK